MLFFNLLGAADLTLPDVPSSPIQVTTASNDNATDAVEVKQFVKKLRKFACPVCGKEVVHLPKHMSKVHDWSDLSGKIVVSQFCLRRLGSSSETDYHMYYLMDNVCIRSTLSVTNCEYLTCQCQCVQTI